MIGEDLLSIYTAALKAVDPASAVVRSLRLDDGMLVAGPVRIPLSSFDRIVVVGAGKATARMAAAAEGILGDRLDEGVIIVKDGHTAPLAKVRQHEAGHPVPDERGVAGTDEIVRLLEQAGGRTLVLCLLSGGGSSLLVSPAPGISLADKQRTTELLLRAGATIDELNAVRKHLSAVKGGRLARTAFPATMVTLVLSDVIGDRLDVIASGPTVPDSSTFADAAAVVDRYGVRSVLPAAVIRHLEGGVRGGEEETVRQDHPCFSTTTTVIIGSIRHALAAAEERAAAMGFRTELATMELRGEAREAGSMLAGRAVRLRQSMTEGKRLCLLSGGETTVTVRGGGIGGRNQELALSFADALEGVPGITLLSAGTDGTDGPTEAAGAVVDGRTAAGARRLGMDPRDYLDRNDSYTFFRRYDTLTGERTHIITGPTGTNVMDLQIVIIENP